MASYQCDNNFGDVGIQLAMGEESTSNWVATASRNRKKLGIAGFSVTALFFLLAFMYSPDPEEISMSSSTPVSSKVESPLVNSGPMSIRKKPVTLIVNNKAYPVSNSLASMLPIDTMADKPISPVPNTVISLTNKPVADKPISPLLNTEISLTNKPVADKPISHLPNKAVATIAAMPVPIVSNVQLVKTPEPFVFPERVHLELGFYVNTPNGKVKGTSTGYFDWSQNADRPRMRWDELYDIAFVNDQLPLLYDGVAGPNKKGEYKYWSMDRSGNFKCMDFPFPSSYPRDLLKKYGTYGGQKVVDGTLCDIWSYKFMGVTIILYVDASDNTVLVKEEIAVNTGRQQEVVQVYYHIKLTEVTKEIDASIFQKLPQAC